METDKLESNITKTKKEIDKLLKEKKDVESKLKYYNTRLNSLIDRINEANGTCYYVYIVFVDGEPKYAGKGKGERYKHAVSGTSSVPELNRDFFNNKEIEVGIFFNDRKMTEERAIECERDVIGSLNCYYELYNKIVPKKYSYLDGNLKQFCTMVINTSKVKRNSLC